MADTYSTQFRTCETTGLKVHLPGERLFYVHAVTAVVALLTGGVMALLIALTRWPAVHLLPADLFYRFLTAHGINMLVFWIVFFEMAGLIFASTAVLGSRLPAVWFGWLNYALMLVGAAHKLYDFYRSGGCDVYFISSFESESKLLSGYHSFCGWCFTSLFSFYGYPGSRKKRRLSQR